MHRVATFVLAFGLARTAAAEERDDFVALPKRSVGIGLLMHGGDISGINEGGAGVTAELALARGRLQLVSECGFAIGGARSTSGDGFATAARAGGALRWIPRSFPVDGGAIDLLFEGFAGAEYLSWPGGNVVRPQLGIGAGWQVRSPRNIAIRISTRIFTSPFAESAATTAVCRGTCSEPTREQNLGFIGFAGAAW